MTSLPTLLTKIEQARAKATQDIWYPSGHNVCTENKPRENGQTVAYMWNPLLSYMNKMDSEKAQLNAEFVALAANHILQLTQACRVMSEALNNIGEPNDVNCNFSKSEDEANYYIQTASEALTQVEALLSSEGEG